MTKYQKLKLLVLSISLICFLLILNSFSENGRYIMKNDGFVIIDSRTGKIYLPQSKKFIDISTFEKDNSTKK